MHFLPRQDALGDEPFGQRGVLGDRERMAAGQRNVEVIAGPRVEGARGGRPVHVRAGRRTPSFFMRDSSVVGLSPSSAAAPRGPLTRPLVWTSARSMASRCTSARLVRGAGGGSGAPRSPAASGLKPGGRRVPRRRAVSASN